MSSENKKRKAHNTLYSNGGMKDDRHVKRFTFFVARERNRLKRELRKDSENLD